MGPFKERRRVRSDSERSFVTNRPIVDFRRGGEQTRLAMFRIRNDDRARPGDVNCDGDVASIGESVPELGETVSRTPGCDWGDEEVLPGNRPTGEGSVRELDEIGLERI